LATAGTATFCVASDGQGGGQNGEDDCGDLHLDACVLKSCWFLKTINERCSEGPSDVRFYALFFRVHPTMHQFIASVI
jgi:hypothetical protein